MIDDDSMVEDFGEFGENWRRKLFEGVISNLIWSRWGFGFEGFDGGGYFLNSEWESGRYGVHLR